MIHEGGAPNDDDNDLVARARSGDESAFGALFERYYDMIYAYAYKLCLNREDAQDVAQETFVRAARALASLRTGHLKAWLFRIASNLSKDTFRRRKPIDGAEFDPDSLAARPAPDHLPAEELLARLSGDLRQAVALVYLEGMNHAEAAQILGCAESTISWRIFAAKRKLRRFLKEPR